MTLWDSPSDLADIRRRHEDFGVICIDAASLRDLGSVIARAALVGNLNHCEIFPHLSTKSQKRLKAAIRWVHYPDWVLPEYRGQIEVF